ncbi:MAG: hypothetical protein Q9221_007779 [Calogaya cf. arnoldii]
MSTATSYFAYGSNLSLSQMTARCPSSSYIGIARLTHYRWIINRRGYANIVQTENPSDIVYGLVYVLTNDDEEQLDLREGVPWAYTKEMMSMEVWAGKSGERFNRGIRDAVKVGMRVKYVEDVIRRFIPAE